MLPTERGQIPSPEESVTVEILTAPQMEAVTKPPAVEKDHTPLISSRPERPVKREENLPQPTSSETASKTGTMVQAKQYFSSKILAAPRSEEALIALRQLGTDERITQLCNVEAMEQVHQWKGDFEPDLLVAYAMADTKLSGLMLEANGGALRSKPAFGPWRADRSAPSIEMVVQFWARLVCQVKELAFFEAFVHKAAAS